MTHLGRTEKQRATTASRVIHIAKPCMADRHYLCQYLTDFLRSVEFSGFLSGSCGKLPNHILIGITKNIYFFRCLHTKLNVIQSQQHIADKRVLILCRLAKFRRSKVYIRKQTAKIFLAVMPQRAIFNAFQRPFKDWQYILFLLDSVNYG